jgi:hypothetical protein
VDVISLDFRTPMLAEKAFAALQTMASAAPTDRPGVALGANSTAGKPSNLIQDNKD